MRYRDISPVLKAAISEIGTEFISLHEDLKCPEMWRRPHLLSKIGLQRWKKTTKIVESCLNVSPDPEWREKWEKERVSPYCTRKEAIIIAVKYVLENIGIDLEEIDSENGKAKYHYSFLAKGGRFRMPFGKWGKIGNPDKDIGVVEVDMLTREARLDVKKH